LALKSRRYLLDDKTTPTSSLKAAESKMQRTLSALQREYEAIENVFLVAKFVGNMEASNLATVIPALFGIRPSNEASLLPLCS
jgi:hypothetical protein